jgi:hypothetical protein
MPDICLLPQHQMHSAHRSDKAVSPILHYDFFINILGVVLEMVRGERVEIYDIWTLILVLYALIL